MMLFAELTTSLGEPRTSGRTSAKRAANAAHEHEECRAPVGDPRDEASRTAATVVASCTSSLTYLVVCFLSAALAVVHGFSTHPRER